MKRLMAVLAMMSGVAMAQPVYKIVGPDGKVSFSDEPPAQGQATLMEGYGSKPKAPEKSEAEQAAERAAAVSREAAERYQAKRAQPATKAEPAASTTDPALARAIIGVLGYEDLIAQSKTLCTGTLPGSMARYTDIVIAWKNRNANVLRQTHYLLGNRMPPGQREAVTKAVSDLTLQQLAVVVKAPAAARIKWCDTSMEQISQGIMDPQRKPEWVTPVARAAGGF